MERRRAARRAPAADEPLSRVRLRAGRELLVVDVSNAGALVEGAARLLPGTHVDVHIVLGEGRTLVRCRIVRAFVSGLDAGSIRYRGALAFERAIDASFACGGVADVLASSPLPAAADPQPHARSW